jgi:hypothetical protein
MTSEKPLKFLVEKRGYSLKEGSYRDGNENENERGKKRKISKECELWKHVKQCIACEKNICETKHSTISFYFRAKLRVCDFVFDSASMKHKCIKLLFN